MSTSGYLSVEAEVTKEENRETAANPLCLGAITFCGLTVLIAGAAYYAHFASPESALVRPEKELKGFKKISLEPGETKTVTFDIEPEMLKYFDDAKHEWVLESGKFTAYVGSASDDIRTSVDFYVK